MLYYIHGYQSSPTSTKAELFKKTLHAIPITYRNGEPETLVISDCLTQISKEIQQDSSVVLIGSSLGGFLAAATALSNPNVKKLILLNPAVIPPKTNLDAITDMPQKILKGMIQPSLFEKKIPAKITILRGTSDTVVPDDWVISFATAQEATILLFDDDHQFTKNMQKLPDIITKLL